MSYGRELNNFKEMAQRYGPEWRAIVLCKSYEQLRTAMQDAKAFIGAESRQGGQYMTVAGNGAKLMFKVVTNDVEATHAVRGLEFTHIIWLYRSDDVKLRSVVRERLRSRKVPSCDCRLEYCYDA